MKNKKAEIGTIVMMAVLVIVSVIAFGSSNSLTKKQTINTKAAAGLACTDSKWGCGSQYGVSSPDYCGGALTCGNVSWGPADTCYRCLGPNCLRSSGPTVDYPANSALTDTTPCCIASPNSTRLCCTETMKASIKSYFSSHHGEVAAFKTKATIYGLACVDELTGGGDTTPAPTQIPNTCSPNGGECRRASSCTNFVSAGNNYCKGILSNDWVCCKVGTSVTNTPVPTQPVSGTNPPAIIDTCSAPPNFVCADIPSGTNAYTACDNYQGNYVLYISTSTNSKSCGSSTKTCCQLNQFAPNNTCVTSNHSCITKNSVMETNTSACRRNNQTPVTDGTTCGDSTKACCQGAGLAPPPFTSSECSQPINCPAGFSGTYYSKSITFTTTQVTKIFYFTSPSDCASNSNYQTTIDAIKTIACRSSSSQALPINQPQVVNLDLKAPLNTPFTIENTTTVQCRNIDPTQIILSVGGYSGNSNPCHSSERVTVITEDQKTIFKCCQI